MFKFLSFLIFTQYFRVSYQFNLNKNGRNCPSMTLQNKPLGSSLNGLNFFKNWHCIGIKENINFNKPYTINIGDLPLVMWKDTKNDKLMTTINICKHMGSQLGNGVITNGCLKCQYHGLEYSKKDTFGTTIEHEGKIYWAYEPIHKTPYTIPFYNDKTFEHSFIEVDMDCSFTDSVYNTMDLRHPEYVHNKIGFGNSIPPQHIKQYRYKDRVGLSFDYNSNAVVQHVAKGTKTTSNYHMFINPNFGWSRVTFDKTKHIIIGINLLPISPKKTRWYITVCHNWYTSPLLKQFVKTMAMTILTQDFIQMRNQRVEDSLKKEMLFQHQFPDEEVILWIKDMLKDYEYPTIDVCSNLYKDYKSKNDNLLKS